MEKKQSGLKIIIALLVVIIILLVGFIIFFIDELIDERDEIRDFYHHDERGYAENNNAVYTSSNSNITNDNTNNNYIPRENALQSALDDAKLNQSDVRDIDVELDYKYGQTVYEVTFDYQQYEYEYYINAENGNIVKSFKEID